MSQMDYTNFIGNQKDLKEEGKESEWNQKSAQKYANKITKLKSINTNSQIGFGASLVNETTKNIVFDEK